MARWSWVGGLSLLLLNFLAGCSLGGEVCTMGTWGSCGGAVGPDVEVCDGLDNDCDGILDNGCALDGGTP